MLHRSFGFVVYMTQYGIALGCLVGFFGAIALTLTIPNSLIQLPRLVPLMLVAGMFDRRLSKMAQSNLMRQIWSPMMMSCFKLGGLVGGAIVVTLAFIQLPLNHGIFLCYAICAPALFGFGACVGASFGGVIGYISGLAMWWITKQEQLARLEFTHRVSTGLATAWITAILLLPLTMKTTDIPYGAIRDNYVMALASSIVIAVYASQRVITRYRHDVDFG